MLSADRLLSRGAIAAWMMLIAIPLLWPLGPRIEGFLLPVTGKVQVSKVEQRSEGLAFFVKFTKRRQCEFEAIIWYEGPVRLTLTFEPEAEQQHRTRPVGDQYIGPWLLNGVSDLDGVVAYVLHRCHPLWMTLTRFYP
ncbi:hypothetical protein [Mesorhizobium sp. Z1-4]|uniref:hypothetical protein n=1 Tax=Mesorhizobium sp. Z1-4 TaxID=2448478 RepID=UPI000FD8DD42|nr:hypothetical protein [Mesorhizobium sp. Z1-4]